MPALIALALGLILTPSLAWVGRRVGLVDRPSDDELKIHTRAVPLTGGIALVAAVLVAMAAAGEGLDPRVAGSILLLLVVGVVDDVVMLPPPARVAAELAAGGLMVAGGLTFSPLGTAGRMAVVVAVPVVANAVNVVDGHDGLAGGLCLAAAIGMSLVLEALGGSALLGLTLAAALVAFLVWNRPRASVFLGDGGAYGTAGLLVVLATLSSASWPGLLGSVACLGVFGLELGSTMLRRAMARSSLTSGDRAHVYDLLAVRLGSRERATIVMIAAGLAAAVLGWLVVELPLAGGLAVLVVATASGSVAIAALWRANGIRLRHPR